MPMYDAAGLSGDEPSKTPERAETAEERVTKAAEHEVANRPAAPLPAVTAQRAAGSVTVIRTGVPDPSGPFDAHDPAADVIRAALLAGAVRASSTRAVMSYAWRGEISTRQETSIDIQAPTDRAEEVLRAVIAAHPDKSPSVLIIGAESAV